MKIFAVGMNYPAHNKEQELTLFKNGEPVLYTKPDSSLLKNGKPFFLPEELGRVEAHAELVVRINRLGKGIPVRFAHRYYDAFTVGVNFVAADLLDDLRRGGLPWDRAVGFDGAAVLGEWIDKEALPPMDFLSFSLSINGRHRQEGHVADMVRGVDELIAYISRYVTLRTGDILFTGSPAAAPPVAIDDRVEGFLQDRKVLLFNVK